MKLYQLLSCIPDNEDIIITKFSFIDWDTAPVADNLNGNTISDFWGIFDVKRVEISAEFSMEPVLTILIADPGCKSFTVQWAIEQAVYTNIKKVQILNRDEELDITGEFNTPSIDEVLKYSKRNVSGVGTIDDTLILYIDCDD